MVKGGNPMMTYPTSEGTLPGTLDVHVTCLCGLTRDVTVSESSLRMLALGESPAVALADLGRFGPVSAGSDDWLTLSPLALEAVPDVVAAVVGAGGRVHAVDAGRSTLEDLFMRLVGGTGTTDGEPAAGEGGQGREAPA